MHFRVNILSKKSAWVKQCIFSKTDWLAIHGEKNKWGGVLLMTIFDVSLVKNKLSREEQILWTCFTNWNSQQGILYITVILVLSDFSNFFFSKTHFYSYNLMFFEMHLCPNVFFTNILSLQLFNKNQVFLHINKHNDFCVSSPKECL